MSNGILIWSEVTCDKFIHPVVFELVAKSRELSEKLTDAPVMALILTSQELGEDIKETFRINGFQKVFIVQGEVFSEYKSDIYSKVAIKAVEEISPEIMFIGATSQGRDLAPRISTALHTGLTADCTGLDILENGKLAATRPTFGGQLMATILSKANPQMATIRPNVFKPEPLSNKADTEFINLAVDTSDYKSAIDIIDFKKKVCSEVNNIDSAEIIVAGGRGMQSKAGFELLKQLADKIGGTVGASRVAVEMGLCSAEYQIGQTGKTVTPKLYIACGISGALQHTIGMENSSKIIAINKDEKAPIFNIADYGYVGDVFEVIPRIIESL